MDTFHNFQRLHIPIRATACVSLTREQQGRAAGGSYWEEGAEDGVSVANASHCLLIQLGCLHNRFTPDYKIDTAANDYML